MALDTNLAGGTSGVKADVNASKQLMIVPETNAVTNPGNVGGIRLFSEVDSGAVGAAGSAYLLSPETDDDFRMRVGHETLLDCETFNYAAQNTGKHFSVATTMVPAWAVTGFKTNSTGLTTTTIGTTGGTYAYWPIIGAHSTYCEVEGGFDAQPVANTIIDFGLFLRGAANPYAPTDGVYFRLTSAGLFGVINNNGTETTTSVFQSVGSASAFTYTNNQKHQFIITITEREVEFWIDGNLYGTLDVPVAQGQPFMSSSLPFSWRHAITGGAAGGAITFILNDYTVSLGGGVYANEFGDVGNRVFGSYQGLSGGTMGSLANYANSANPTAAVPTNTTAALGTGLGGQVWETDTLAVTTDGIILSYQVPAGTVNIAGKRLVLRGVTIQSFVQTILTGGGYVASWSLAFGHTAVSLATAEATGAKAPRRVPLGLQTVAAAAAALTLLQTVQLKLDVPVYVNPGEFIAVVKKKIGTAPSAGVVGHLVTYDYGWE